MFARERERVRNLENSNGFVQFHATRDIPIHVKPIHIQEERERAGRDVKHPLNTQEKATFVGCTVKGIVNPTVNESSDNKKKVGRRKNPSTLVFSFQKTLMDGDDKNKLTEALLLKHEHNFFQVGQRIFTLPKKT